MGILGDDTNVEGSLGLGELADLNVSNEGDSPIHDVSKAVETCKIIVNMPLPFVLQ